MANILSSKTSTPQKGKNALAEQTKVELELLEAERVLEEGVASVIDIIAPAALRVTANYIQVGNQYAATMFLYAYSRYVQTGWFSPIINLSKPFDVSIYIYPVDSAQILKTLKNRTAQVQSQIDIEAEKGSARDPMLETAYKDIEELRDKLQQGTERFFKLGVYLTAYADTEKDLRDSLKEIESLLQARLIYTKRSLLQMEQGFNSTMPLANDELGITTNMNTAPISTIFPFISSDLTTNKGILYGINRHNSSLILFDRFSMENANTVVFAKSGGGKSYMTKLEVLRSMMIGADVIIIDPEKEYEHLAETVDGAYLDISLSSQNRINPFDLPRSVEGESIRDLVRQGVTQVKALVNLMLGKLDPTEDALMDLALIQTYAKRDITEESSDLSTVEFPTMTDLMEILQGMSGAESLAQRLTKFTEGTFAGLFSQSTNININKQLVVFSIRDLEDELRPIGMFLVLSYIWNITRSHMKKRIMVIDEAWIMMQFEDSARFLHGLAKRARKYFLGITTITQDVQDFLNNDYGRAVVTNSSIQILLKQSEATIDVIAQTFHLTEGEKFLLLESGVGEGIFRAGTSHVAIKVYASYSEDQIITSDPQQLLEIEEAKNAFREAQEALKNGSAPNSEPTPAPKTTGGEIA